MTGAPRRSHLVFVTITFHPEPGAMRGLPLAARLVRDAGYDVSVVTAIPWYPLGRYYDGYRLHLWRWEEIDGVRVLRLPIYPSHDRSALRRVLTYLSFMASAFVLAPLLVRRGDAIYHVDNLPTTGLVTCALRALWGAPIVQHIGDLWPDSVLASGMVRGRVARAAERTLHGVQRFIYQRDRVITVLSPGFRRILIDRGVPAAKLLVLPNWADEDVYAPEPADPAYAERLGTAGKFTVVYAGNVGPMQALDVVARAAGHLRDRPDVQFLIVGDGPSLPALREAVREAGLEGVVRLLGRRPVAEMAQLNAVADALLVHLKDEPFLHATVPSKLQVGLLSGRPILLGARGDAADIMRASAGGRVFEPDSGESLAGAVRDLADLGPAGRAAMGARGRAYYDAHLSMRAGVATMAALFDDLVSERNSGPSAALVGCAHAEPG